MAGTQMLLGWRNHRSVRSHSALWCRPLAEIRFSQIVMQHTLGITSKNAATAATYQWYQRLSNFPDGQGWWVLCQRTFAEGIKKEISFGVSHPILRTHPETGKTALYLNGGFLRHESLYDSRTGETLDVEESKEIVSFLQQQHGRPEYVCQFKWQVRLYCFLGQPSRAALCGKRLLSARKGAAASDGER